VISAELSRLFERYSELRDQYFAQTDGFAADAIGDDWVPVFYEILEFPTVTPEDTVAKAKFILAAVEKHEMNLFEDEGITFLRSIASIPMGGQRNG
jgi:hypothetical protein